MKIAIDLTSLADNFSGMERYALSIAGELIELDYKKQHTYVLLFKRKVHPAFEKYRDSKHVIMRTFQGNDKLFFGQVQLPFHLYFQKADAYLFLAFPSPLLFHKRGIYNTIHDLTCWDCPETMQKKMQIFFKLSLWNAVLCSKGIIVNSKFTMKRVKEKFRYRKKITLAYCGISDIFIDYVKQQTEVAKETREKIAAGVRSKYHLPEQYLLCLATLEPRKNLPFLVRTYVELLREENIHIPLVLAGRKGWHMDAFLEEIESDYRKQIIVTGFIDEADLPYVYHMADCFIFPSIYEGFGMPPLEAMTVGTLVISANTASLPEVLGKAASYFEVSKKEELKERIKQGIGQQCDDITIREIKKRVEKFRWKRSAQEVARLFEMESK